MFHAACDALVNIVYIITFRHTWSADDSAESDRTVEGGALYSGLRHWVRTGFRWKTTQPSHPKIHADLMTMATLIRIVTADQDIESFFCLIINLWLSDWLQRSQMSKALSKRTLLRCLKIRTWLITMATSNEDQSNVILSSSIMYSRVSIGTRKAFFQVITYG